jgi:hypothetical protein
MREGTGASLRTGGRVLNVCALGKTVTEAQERAYEAGRRPYQVPEGILPRDIGGLCREAGSGEDNAAFRRRATRVDPKSEIVWQREIPGFQRFACPE